MVIDWKDQTRVDRLKFEMVSATNLNDVYGELDGVDLSGSTLDAAYYTDLRTSGRLAVRGDGWVRGSRIRITHEVPDWNYSRVLGTYFVTADPASRHHGGWDYELNLESSLKGLSEDRLVRPWTIAKNAMALTAIRKCIGDAKQPYDVSRARNAKIKTPQVIDSGTARIEALFTLCKLSNNRVDVSGNGTIVVAPYVLPASKAAKFRIDLEEPRGIAFDDLERESDWLSMPNVAAVSHKYSDTIKKNGKSETVQREINAYAQVSNGAHQSQAIRGYTITSFESLSELSPRTAARAQQIAKQNLNKDVKELVTWSLTTTYLPIWEGDVVELAVHDGMQTYRGVRKCLVKNVSLDLQHMTMRLTLKETASGDEED